MRTGLKKKGTVRFHETFFGDVQIPFGLRRKSQEFIEKTALRYLENIQEHAQRDPVILWRLALAYEKA